jgi:hypothetical protein
MHVRRTLALAIAVPLFLAGCSEKAEPTPKMPDPTESSTSSPSPTESTTAQAERAEDFIRRWSDALRDMQISGDSQAFRELGPDCESCLETAKRVDQIYDAGGEIRWAGWTIHSIEPNGKAANEYRVVETSAPTRFRESADAPWQRLAGGRTRHVIELEPSSDSWVVVRTAELA